MRDPFRTNAKQQLIREAQIGLTAVAIVLALFLYVAFYKISGRGRHITDRVRNAPIAEPSWPNVNSGNDSAPWPKTDLDVGTGRLALKASKTSSIESDRLIARPKTTNRNPISSSSKQFDSFNPLAPSSKNQVTEISGYQGKPAQLEKTKLAGRIRDSASSIPNSFGTREMEANKSANPFPDRLDEAGPHASPAATSRRQTGSGATDLVAAKNTLSNSDTKPNWFEPESSEANDVRAADSSMPQMDTFNADPLGKKHDVQLTSAISNEIKSASRNDFEPNQGKIVKDDLPMSLHPRLPKPSINQSGVSQTFAEGLRPDSSDDSSHNDFEPVVGNNHPVRNDLPTSSAKSQGTAITVMADDSWPGDSHKSFPPSPSKSDRPTPGLPTLRSPRPLPDVEAHQFKQLSGAVQEDIAKVLVPDESRTTIETPVQPTGTPANMISPRSATYTVREGDSYWSISADVYNDGRFFRALYEHNRFVTPSFELDPGTKVATPIKSDLIKLWPNHCPCDELDLTDEINCASSDADSRFYFTQRGDTLFEIAGQKLGQASRYLEIYRLNQARLDSKVNHLSPLPSGVRLVLPPQ